MSPKLDQTLYPVHLTSIQKSCSVLRLSPIGFCSPGTEDLHLYLGSVCIVIRSVRPKQKTYVCSCDNLQRFPHIKIVRGYRNSERMGCIPNSGTWPVRVVLLLLVGRRVQKPAFPLVSVV